jgi:hypothetical protein
MINVLIIISETMRISCLRIAIGRVVSMMTSSMRYRETRGQSRSKPMPTKPKRNTATKDQRRGHSQSRYFFSVSRRRPCGVALASSSCWRLRWILRGSLRHRSRKTLKRPRLLIGLLPVGCGGFAVCFGSSVMDRDDTTPVDPTSRQSFSHLRIITELASSVRIHPPYWSASRQK